MSAATRESWDWLQLLLCCHLYPGFKIQCVTISLAQGDTLFLYTDGLTEDFLLDGDLFGVARLMDSLKSAQAQTPEEVFIAVENRLNEFIGSIPLGDNLTMLVIKMDSVLPL